MISGITSNKCRSMEGNESVLEAILDEEEGEPSGEDEALDDDVQMLEALSLDGATAPPAREATRSQGVGGGGTAAAEGGSGPGIRNLKLKVNNKKKKKSKRRKKSGADNITDINRFVMETCKHLREKKPYLVWNAVGCLGVSAISDLVKEVDVIQRCGGQRTADGNRLRTGGGILWNILRSREPKAYKEIMEKGREFEKQFRQPKRKKASKEIEEAIPPGKHGPGGAAARVLDGSECVPGTRQQLEPTDSDKGRMSVLNRIRMPVAYDDLYEEGEIHD